MQRPHVLKSVTLPRQRLGVTENALVLPLCIGGVFFLTAGVLAGAVAWLVIHTLMVVVCHIEPHVVSVLQARCYYPRTRRLQGRGNTYGV